VSRSRFALAIIILAAVVATPLLADVTAEQALELARAAAIAQNPELGQPDTTVRTSYSDKVLALDISDPYRLNGQVYWKTYTHYENTKVAVAQYTGIGDKVHATQAAGPMASEVPDELKPKVLEWLAYWDAQSSLDPELRVGAHLTKAHGFYFKRGSFTGPSALIGVDAEGQVFRLDVSGPLVPWRLGQGADVARARLFEQLFEGID
jgi:hypothetical protein